VLAVKAAVDRDRRRGQFILTGSTNFLTVPTISESLAGRADFVTLWPLSQGELHGGTDGFVDRAFAGPEALLAHRGAAIGRDEYLERLCLGGMPDLLTITERGRRRWFQNYVATVLSREVETAGDIRRSDAMSAMVRYFAATTASELVLSTAAERLGIARATTAEYLPWLQTVFLIHQLPAWSRNLTAKVVKRPKIHMVDTGVAANLLGRRPEALRHPTEPATGPLFETFVVNEIAKQLTWCDTFARLFHFRDRDGTEVDAVAEADDGRVVAVDSASGGLPRVEQTAGRGRSRWRALRRRRTAPHRNTASAVRRKAGGPARRRPLDLANSRGAGDRDRTGMACLEACVMPSARDSTATSAPAGRRGPSQR
jgi:predicted AAA+ superfamily ATPase